MMTVHEVSKISGVSIRALHHYDHIGLLKATAVTRAGYRLYDDTALARLQLILLFRELEFPLKEIAAILDSPDFDRAKALEQQIRLLELRKEHLEKLIVLARDITMNGETIMNKKSFEAFDTQKIEAYTKEAKASWGQTAAYREYETKAAGRSCEEERNLSLQLMDIFAEFGSVRDKGADSEEARALVRKLQDHITAHYYTCTDAILESLGRMYAAGGEMTENIDAYAGQGTAVYANECIEAYLLGKR